MRPLSTLPAHRHPTLDAKLVDVVYGSLYLVTKVLVSSQSSGTVFHGHPINTHLDTIWVFTIGGMPVAAFTSCRVTIHDRDDEVSLEVLPWFNTPAWRTKWIVTVHHILANGFLLCKSALSPNGT